MEGEVAGIALWMCMENSPWLPLLALVLCVCVSPPPSITTYRLMEMPGFMRLRDRLDDTVRVCSPLSVVMALVATRLASVCSACVFFHPRLHLPSLLYSHAPCGVLSADDATAGHSRHHQTDTILCLHHQHLGGHLVWCLIAHNQSPCPSPAPTTTTTTTQV